MTDVIQDVTPVIPIDDLNYAQYNPNLIDLQNQKQICGGYHVNTNHSISAPPTARPYL
jgi:hypothetical protein